jgi:hypothetical protein
MEPTAQDLGGLYEHVPADGSTISNGKLRQMLGWDDARYALVKTTLVNAGRLRLGPGRGGTVRRSDASCTLNNAETAGFDGGEQPPADTDVGGSQRSNIIVGPWVFPASQVPIEHPAQPRGDPAALDLESASSPVMENPPHDYSEIDPSRVAKAAFTRSGQIVKSIMAMNGMIRGMPIDRPLNDAEIEHCHAFVKEHWALFEKSNKAGILHDFLDAIVDVKLTTEEREHLLTALAQADEAYYDAITRHLQELHGLLGFAAADRQIEPHAVAALRTWVTDNAELAGTWPYDDIVVLVEGLVDRPNDDAVQVLLRYAMSFEGRSLAPSTPVSVETGEALFTSSPRPIVPGRVVCITGGSIFMPRSSIAPCAERGHAPTASISDP